MFIKILLLAIFFAVTLFVGFYFRKKATSVYDFVLGGRNVGPWITAFSFGTSYFSAVIFVGFAGQFGWRFGTAATWIGLGNAFIGALLAWNILGRRTRIMTNHLGSATMPAFLGTRFNSNALKIGASLIVFLFLIPYTASLYNGLSRLFEMAFGIDFIWCIVGIAVLTAIYVVAGGYLGQAVNDFIQGIVMLVGIVVITAAVLNDNGGFLNALQGLSNVEAANVNGVTQPGVLTSFFGPDPIALLGVVILTSLGTWGLPHMVARFYSIKSEKMIKKGTIISTIFAVVVAGGCYFLGSFGRLYGDVVVRNPETGAVAFDSIIPKMLEGFPNLLIGLVLVLVFAASMSTLSSLVIASSSTLTLDFLKGNVFKKMKEKSQLLTIRVLIVVFIILSSAIAVFQYQSKGTVIWIAQLMGISWGALAGAFLAPFLYGLFWKGVTKAAVWCNFAFSVTVMVSNIVLKLFLPDVFVNYFPKLLQDGINCGAFVMLAGLIIVPVVSLFTKKPDKEFVDDCFSCYEETVEVKVSTDLGDK